MSGDQQSSPRVVSGSAIAAGDRAIATSSNAKQSLAATCQQVPPLPGYH